MPGGLLLVTGAFFALMAVWALNHEGAVGSTGMWTSWVSGPTKAAVTWFVLLGGLAMMAVAVFG